MVEKNDQKKCRDISTEIQEILAKWGKYFFYYYPKEHRIRPSEFAARHMGIVENARIWSIVSSWTELWKKKNC